MKSYTIYNTPEYDEWLKNEPAKSQVQIRQRISHIQDEGYFALLDTRIGQMGPEWINKRQDMQDHKWHDKQDKFSETTRQILGCCFEVTNTLGSGFVESIYRNALVIALRVYHPAHHATCDHVDPVPF